MAIPTFDKFIEPLLRYLITQPDGASAGDANEAVANLAGVTVDERQQLLPSGIQQIYKNRIGWAHDRLKRSHGRQRLLRWTLVP